jgi:hypothetical protein
MRPDPACRTFNSTAVEASSFTTCLKCLADDIEQKVIAEMKERIADPDLARLFENTFPNTLGEIYNITACELR